MYIIGEPFLLVAIFLQWIYLFINCHGSYKAHEFMQRRFSSCSEKLQQDIGAIFTQDWATLCSTISAKWIASHSWEFTRQAAVDGILSNMVCVSSDCNVVLCSTDGKPLNHCCSQGASQVEGSDTNFFTRWRCIGRESFWIQPMNWMDMKRKKNRRPEKHHVVSFCVSWI